MDELVRRLADGEHSVAIGGPKPSLQEFQQRVQDLGYVFLKFTDTRGGTDLGIRIDRGATDLSKAHFELGSGTAHVEGTLTLNYVQVRCVADIDLATLHGRGHLVILAEVGN